MHKFLIYLSIYFCLTCFGLSFSPSSEAGLQIREWFKSPGYGASARALHQLVYYVGHYKNFIPKRTVLGWLNLKHFLVERETKFKTDIQVRLTAEAVRRNLLSVVMSLNAPSYAERLPEIV
jgi:hypothetical protein